MEASILTQRFEDEASNAQYLLGPFDLKVITPRDARVKLTVKNAFNGIQSDSLIAVKCYGVACNSQWQAAEGSETDCDAADSGDE